MGYQQVFNTTVGGRNVEGEVYYEDDGSISSYRVLTTYSAAQAAQHQPTNRVSDGSLICIPGITAGQRVSLESPNKSDLKAELINPNGGGFNQQEADHIISQFP